MTDKRVWFITGTGRGMGVDFAKAALVAGNAVVATGRNTDAVRTAVGEAEDLLVVQLDVTSPEDAEAAVKAAVDRFGRIAPHHVDLVRRGPSGFEFNSAYAAAKFGLEGWMESLQAEVAPFGITTTIVNPGFFRTDLLTQESATYATPSIADYADRHAQRVQWYDSMNGQQAGDPGKLARALITIARQEQPPRRFIGGADAIAIAEQEAKDLQEQANAFRDLPTSLARDDG
jgi:NAD(P)-dependent dehydrogenase (short-subunit alcohol dehydrogenase family)